VNMGPAQLTQGEQAFYLYVSQRRKPTLDTSSVFYRVVGEQMATALSRLFGKEYSSKSGKPGFFLKPSGEVDPDDQILLDDALAWIDVYDHPDPGVFDEIPPADVLVRAAYARRAHDWEAMIAERKSREIGGRTEESTNRDQHDSLKSRVAAESELAVKPRAKRGPKANMDFHRAVAEVVNSFGMNWQGDSSLDRIARELEGRKIPSLKSWLHRSPPARSWGRAVEQHSHVVRKALEYSLKMVARDTTQSPSETLGNLR
jgi:hypothetical protein